MPPQNLPNLNEHLGPEQLPVGWPWRFFLFSLLVFITALVVYLGLSFGYRPFLNNQIVVEDQALQDLAKVVPEDQQKSLINFYSQLANLQNLLNKHVRLSKIFTFLSENTNKLVYYTFLDLRAIDRRLGLEGIAQNYDIFSQQLEAFNRSPAVENLIVSDSSASDGQVKFRLLLTLAPTLFK